MCKVFYSHSHTRIIKSTIIFVNKKLLYTRCHIQTDKNIKQFLNP